MVVAGTAIGLIARCASQMLRGGLVGNRSVLGLALSNVTIIAATSLLGLVLTELSDEE